MIRIGDLLLIEVPKTARNITVAGINTIEYFIGERKNTMKTPFSIGAPIFSLIGHLEDIKNNNDLIKRMLIDNVKYSGPSGYCTWQESLESWLIANDLVERANEFCVVRYSIYGFRHRFLETLPKKAVKLSESDIKLTRMIPGKKKKYKTNKYNNEIIINGKKILEIVNFEVTPNVYYLLESDKISNEGKSYSIRNTSAFIAKHQALGNNPFIEMTKEIKIWKTRIYILTKEES